ncbi:MAG: 4-phosphoerythronate dehydrogenase [Mariprofundaceae bacterium]
MRRLAIVADRHIWEVESALNNLPGWQVQLTTLERGEINAKAVRDADILLVRSGVKVRAELLAGSRIRFVATATVGDDHLDKAYLDEYGIPFATAAGSSTRSVVEYILAALLHLHRNKHIHLPDTCLGVIGAGRIGSDVMRAAQALGMRVLANDPPRMREGSPDLKELSELWQADILTLHTPLTRTGRDATHHLLDDEQLLAFTGRGIINAARGGVLHDAALLRWLNGDASRFAVLDCWENEPAISRPLLAHPGVLLATPHIAGHSIDGKAANTQFVYDALCRFLGIAPSWSIRQHLPEDAAAPLVIKTGSSHMDALADAGLALYAIDEDDKRLRACLNDLDGNGLAASFVQQRRHYPPRRQWDASPINFTLPAPELLRIATAIGLRIV